MDFKKLGREPYWWKMPHSHFIKTNPYLNLYSRTYLNEKFNEIKRQQSLIDIFEPGAAAPATLIIFFSKAIINDLSPFQVVLLMVFSWSAPNQFYIHVSAAWTGHALLTLPDNLFKRPLPALSPLKFKLLYLVKLIWI